jgi:hypothetical protein
LKKNSNYLINIDINSRAKYLTLLLSKIYLFEQWYFYQDEICTEKGKTMTIIPYIAVKRNNGNGFRLNLVNGEVIFYEQLVVLENTIKSKE